MRRDREGERGERTVLVGLLGELLDEVARLYDDAEEATYPIVRRRALRDAAATEEQANALRNLLYPFTPDSAVPNPATTED